MDLEQTYEQLTAVNINEQKMIWDERGKGYYGEYLLFCELYKHIPGNCKILMNLNIPAIASNTTEIDLLMIHETGFYVFEIKHYKGTIYGDSDGAIWTQYFRTAKNNTFKNPVNQNEYHVSSLKKLYPTTPINSCIVFTHPDCILKVNNPKNSIDICNLDSVSGVLFKRISDQNEVLSADDIDRIFDELVKYSPMKKPIAIGLSEADFYSWVKPTITRLNEKKTEVEDEKSRWSFYIKKLKKARLVTFLHLIVLSLVCVVISYIVVTGYKVYYDIKIEEHEQEMYDTINNYNNQITEIYDEVTKFKQNFLHVDEIDNDYIDSLKSYVQISNVSLQPLTDDAVSFTARISTTNDTYGISLTENSKYIVMTMSGKVLEYDVFGEHLAYNRYSNSVGTGIRNYGDLAQVQFYGISDTSEISYIKINEVELFKLDGSRTVIKDSLEIELYSTD